MAEILIRPADYADVPDIMRIMTAAHQAMSDPSAYITDDADYVKARVEDEGFILLATVDSVPAGFFLISIPGLEKNNPGYHLGLTERQLYGVAIMDSVAVHPDYQGLGLMERMLREVVEQLELRYPYLLGTVARDNLPSRRSFEKCGFTAVKNIVKPGGQKRLLMARIQEGSEAL